MENIILICGDFNCPAVVVWSTDCENNDVLFRIDNNVDCVEDMFSRLLSNGLNQVNFARNYQNNLLDLVFVSVSDHSLNKLTPFFQLINITYDLMYLLVLAR